MPAEPHASFPAREPDLIAVAFVADWCAACKAMKPKLAAAMKASADSSCLFVNVDQTDRHSSQGEYLLASLGLADLWKDNAGKTGFVLLVNPRSHEIVGRLTADQDVNHMTTTIRSFAS